MPGGAVDWDKCKGCGKPLDGVHLHGHLLNDCGLKPENEPQADFSDFVG